MPQESDGAALALQRSLLRQRPPVQQAVETAVRYLPADPQAGVGGDWFDVIALSGARVDPGRRRRRRPRDLRVRRHGTAAYRGPYPRRHRSPPDELLTDLDDLILEEARQDAEAGGEVGATCLYVVYDPVSRHCSLASAGHPPPVIVSPEGAAEFVAVETGPPLGVAFEAAAFPVPAGSLLVLYADGLIEARDRDIGVGLHQLRTTLTHPARGLDDVCDTVVKTLLPEVPGDDGALLVARTRALTASHVASWTVPGAPSAVPQARRRATAQLLRWGLPEAVATTELIVSELVPNAIRHADAPIELRLIHDGSLICEVSDASSTSPHPRRAHDLDEGGRGLFLVGRLSKRWGTRHNATGKTIWAEQSWRDVQRGSDGLDGPAPSAAP